MSQGVSVVHVGVYDRLSSVVAAKHEGKVVTSQHEAEIFKIPCATAFKHSGHGTRGTVVFAQASWEIHASRATNASA